MSAKFLKQQKSYTGHFGQLSSVKGTTELHGVQRV